MSTSPKNTAVRVGAVAGFLAMAVAGWQLAGKSEAAANGTPASETIGGKASQRAARPASRYGTPAHVREAMKTIRNAGSTEARMRATIELANSLPVSELAAWLDGRWFDTGEGFDLTLFNKIAKHRWQKEDPEGLLVWSFKNGPETARSILAEWSGNDPQRMIDFFKAHPDDVREIEALSEVAKSNPALALGRFQEMIARGISPNAAGYYDQQLLNQLATKSPAALEAALDSLPGPWQDKIEAALVGQRLKTSFSEEIRNLWERPDGWKLFEAALQGDGIGSKLLGELADLPASWKASLSSNYYQFVDASNGEKWLEADLEGSGFTAEQAKQIRLGALQRMTYQKPEVVLKHLGEMDLSVDDMRAVISNVFINAARNPAKVEELMALLGSDAEREAARSVLTVAPQNPAEVKIEQPADWLLKAAGTAQGMESYQLFRMLGQWEQGKVQELAGQFRSMPDEGKLPVARLIATGSGHGTENIDPSLKGEAIHYLVSNPPDEAEAGPSQRQLKPEQLASMHAVHWAVKDPVAASDWVQTLPAGDSKLWAQKNVAANWAQYDPEAAGQWAASLPAEARAEVQAFMKKGAGD